MFKSVGGNSREKIQGVKNAKWRWRAGGRVIKKEPTSRESRNRNFGTKESTSPQNRKMQTAKRESGLNTANHKKGSRAMFIQLT